MRVLSPVAVPNVSWERFSKTLHQIGGGSPSYLSLDGDTMAFMTRLGLVTRHVLPKTVDYSDRLKDPRWWVRLAGNIAEAQSQSARVRWLLTPLGKDLYVALFVNNQHEMAVLVLQAMGAKDPVIRLIVRTFTGDPKVRLQQLQDLLRVEKIQGADYETRLQNFLDLLEGFGIVELERRWWTFRITNTSTVQPTSLDQPRLLSPSSPFSNRQRIKEILAHFSGHIYWVDKHFRREALAWLVEAVDTDQTAQVTIISGTDNVTKQAQDDFKNAAKEFQNRGVAIEWKVIPREHTHILHDRWIWDASKSFNVPAVGSILANQITEILPTTNRPPIDQFLAVAMPVLDYQPPAPERSSK